jgi:PPOX class probable F420-dependent enzyme
MDRLRRDAAVFLRSARIAHLATASADGAPHVIPICFVFDGSRIYSPIDEKPKKSPALRLKRVRNIAANARVALIVDHYEEDWSGIGYVLISGTARLLQRGTGHRKAVSLLRRKYRQYRSMTLETRPVIVIVPRHVSSWGSFTPSVPYAG